MVNEAWTRFWFEGNHYFHWVNDREDWEKVKAAYNSEWIQLTVDDLLNVRVCTSATEGSRPYHKYGFASECNGDKTLREFFKENGMAP
jgi:hypothetical protein